MIRLRVTLNKGHGNIFPEYQVHHIIFLFLLKKLEDGLGLAVTFNVGLELLLLSWTSHLCLLDRFVRGE